MEQFSSMQLEVEVKKEETDYDSFSTVTSNPITAWTVQPEGADKPMMVKTEPADHHVDIEGIDILVCPLYIKGKPLGWSVCT